MVANINTRKLIELKKEEIKIKEEKIQDARNDRFSRKEDKRSEW